MNIYTLEEHKVSCANLATKYPNLYAEWKLTEVSIYDYLETNNIYISTYPHAHHKHGMFYAAVVQCFSQVYYSYYEWQGDNEYFWQTEMVHHTEFGYTKKELSNATHEQALERAMDIAFGLIHDNLNNE
jgi:hypothetical protein